MLQRPLTTIRCKECSHALSSRAKKCPLCGCPVEKSVERNVLPHRWPLVISSIVILAIVILIVIVLGQPDTGANNGIQEASSQQGRSEGADGPHETTPQEGRSPAPTAAASSTATPPRTTTVPTAAPAFLGNAVFPTTVSPKYAGESSRKARMHTCLDQYKANKSTNANGGLKWIQKGGGYYSECNRRLKG
jgi:hypothetical protein